MTLFESLKLAQEIVEQHGDPMWFCEHYQLMRENHGILESCETALAEQGLLQMFTQRRIERESTNPGTGTTLQ